MSLPPEIRNLVYACHLVSPGRVQIKHIQRLAFFRHHREACTGNRLAPFRVDDQGHTVLKCTDPFSKVEQEITAPWSKLDLLRVNKQIGDEASLIFFTYNNFYFHTSQHMDDVIHNWPTRVGLIRRMTIHFRTSAPGNRFAWSQRLRNFLALENLQLFLDVEEDDVRLNKARNLITARSMKDFTRLGGIKRLHMVGRDRVVDEQGNTIIVDVNDPRAAGRIIARRLMDLPADFIFRESFHTSSSDCH